MDIETVEGEVTPISAEPGIAMVAPTWVETFKSPKGEVNCKGCAYDEDELARAIDLPLLKCIHKQSWCF